MRRRLSHEDRTRYEGTWGHEEVQAGVGATPSRRGYRVGYAALVTPTPGHRRQHFISSADANPIRAGYERDLLWISDRSILYLQQIIPESQSNLT